MDWRNHIDSDPNVIGGKLRIKGTRLGVAFLLELFAAGWTQDEVLESYTHLTTDDIKALFAFASEAASDTQLLPPEKAAA